MVGFIIRCPASTPSRRPTSRDRPDGLDLIGGMSVALYTTLVGAVLNIWLMLNYRLLEGGTRLFTAIVELGERDA